MRKQTEDPFGKWKVWATRNRFKVSLTAKIGERVCSFQIQRKERGERQNFQRLGREKWKYNHSSLPRVDKGGYISPVDRGERDIP